MVAAETGGGSTHRGATHGARGGELRELSQGQREATTTEKKYLGLFTPASLGRVIHHNLQFQNRILRRKGQIWM